MTGNVFELDGAVQALAGLLVFAVGFLSWSFLLPAGMESTLIGIPTWYWLTAGTSAGLWVLFSVVARHTTDLYEWLGVYD
jgi:hypothetical protein